LQPTTAKKNSMGLIQLQGSFVEEGDTVSLKGIGG